MHKCNNWKYIPICTFVFKYYHIPIYKMELYFINKKVENSLYK